METQNTPEQGNPGEALTNRVRLINTATGGVFDALLKLNREAGQDELPAPALTLIEHALTLINCGVIALTEIADAQQRLANLSERDIAAEIASAVDDAAEAKAAIKFAETTRRSFIGKPKNSG